MRNNRCYDLEVGPVTTEDQLPKATADALQDLR
jgi:hypothetical protein